MTEPGDVTELLLHLESEREEGGQVVDLLFSRIYDELRRLASARLRAERAGHTLSATALVHEAYMKLVRQERVDWKNRAHFFAVAARAMRRILMDHAIARSAQKRGGGAAQVTLGTDAAPHDSDIDNLLAIDEAMSRLAELQPRAERVVELRFFGGLSMEEIAEVLEISLASANRDWRTARAFLTVQLKD